MTSNQRGLVIGAGGPIGLAWTAAKLIALEKQTGWDPRTADALLGTSQGSLVVALLGSGIGTADFLGWYRKDLPEGHPLRFEVARPAKQPAQSGLGRPASPGLVMRGVLRPGSMTPYTALSGLLPKGSGSPTAFFQAVEAVAQPGEWVAHPCTWVVAVDYDSGKRVAFGSPGAPACGIREAVLASGTVPGMFEPVVIDGRRYVDGGVVSSTSADLLVPLGLTQVTVLAPMATATAGKVGNPRQFVGEITRRQMVRHLHAEVAKLKKAGVEVTTIVPTKEEAATFGDMLSAKRRFEVFEKVLALSL